MGILRTRARQEVRERRRGQAGGLGAVVPFAQPHRCASAALGDESLGLPLVEDAALQPERALGVVGQRGEIARPHGAQVALGVHVQLDGVEDRITEQPAQERQRAVLVDVVDTVQRRRFAQVVQQVAQVVQQRRGDELVVGAVGFGQQRALQCVFELRHRLAGILFAAAAGEQLLDVLEAQGHGRE